MLWFRGAVSERHGISRLARARLPFRWRVERGLLLRVQAEAELSADCLQATGLLGRDGPDLPPTTAARYTLLELLG